MDPRSVFSSVILLLIAGTSSYAFMYSIFFSKQLTNQEATILPQIERIEKEITTLKRKLDEVEKLSGATPSKKKKK